MEPIIEFCPCGRMLSPSDLFEVEIGRKAAVCDTCAKKAKANPES